MDTLTPDKDDLDRFRRERKSTFATSDRIRESPSLGQPQEQRGGGRGLALVALILVLVVGGAGAWQTLRQEEVIGDLRRQLDEAHRSLNQSRLIIARLEGGLNATEASVAQSGTELSSRLKNIDSEIRKLWDVSNKRNIGLIKENQAKLQELDGGAKKLTERLAGVEASAKTVSARLDELTRQAEGLKTELARVERESAAKTEALIREWQTQLNTFAKRLETLNAALAKQASQPALDGRVKDVETAIKSIDLNRQQLNNRILELERRLNETQLRIDAARTAPAGG